MGNFRNWTSRATGFIDRIFARGMLAQIAAFSVLVAVVWGGAWLVLLAFDASLVGDREGTFEFLNVYYRMINGMDMDPSLNPWIQIFTILLSLLGCVIFSGGLIAVLSNMIERRVEMFQKGLVHYKHDNHFLIIGCGETSSELVEAILNGTASALAEGLESGAETYHGEDIVLVTHGDVEVLRERVLSAVKFGELSRRFRNRIYFYSVDMESDDNLEKLYPSRARAIFILGDADETGGRDVRNLSCMGALSTIVDHDKSVVGRKRPVPVFVEIDRPETFSILQKVSSIPVKKSDRIYLHPFGLHENHARMMWGLYGTGTGRTVAQYRPLDYVPITEDSEKYVHLVIVGMSSSGTALLLEALRICHYANFETKNKKTKITVVDRDFDAKRDAFFAQFPNLNQICDIELEFLSTNIEAPEMRATLAALAEDPDCLLTVAVCLNDPETALSVGLNFPEALYRYENTRKPKGNTVLIRQTKLGALSESVNGEEQRYRYVKVFGKLGADFNVYLLSDKIPMQIHYDYSCFDYRRGNPLTDKVAEVTDPESIAEMERLWNELPEYKRWSNRFQVEMFRTYLRTVGFDVKRASETSLNIRWKVCSRISLHRDVLMRMEHRRWCAEKTLSGFVYGSVRDEVRRVHPDLCSFEHLSEEKRNLSFRPILNLVSFLAQDHWQITELSNES